MGDDEVQRLIDDQRAADAAGARARERWLRQQDTEEATLAGTFVDLAERHVSVRVRTTAGRSHQGIVAGVGRDFARLHLNSGRDLFLVLRAVVAVHPAAGVGAAPAGRPRVGHDVHLREALGRLVPERPWAILLCDGDREPLSGELRSVGTDVLTLRAEGERGALCYVALAAVTEVAVRLS